AQQQPNLAPCIAGQSPVDAKDDQEEDEKAELDEQHGLGWRERVCHHRCARRCSANRCVRILVNSIAPASFKWSVSKRRSRRYIPGYAFLSLKANSTG